MPKRNLNNHYSNKVRGNSPLETVRRECLTCQNDFLAQGKLNRMCYECKRARVDIPIRGRHERNIREDNANALCRALIGLPPGKERIQW